MPASPSTANYHIGKGIVSFKKTGEGSYRDLGNVPLFTYTPEIERLEHFSSRTGIRTKDFSPIIQLSATINITIEEINGDNLAMFALSDVGTDTDGNTVLTGLTETTFNGAIKVVGTNAIGQHVDFDAEVSFVPSGAFSFITDSAELTQMELEAEVLVDGNGAYGVWTVRDENTV